MGLDKKTPRSSLWLERGVRAISFINASYCFIVFRNLNNDLQNPKKGRKVKTKHMIRAVKITRSMIGIRSRKPMRKIHPTSNKAKILAHIP